MLAKNGYFLNLKISLDTRKRNQFIFCLFFPIEKISCWLLPFPLECVSYKTLYVRYSTPINKQYPTLSWKSLILHALTNFREDLPNFI